MRKLGHKNKRFVSGMGEFLDSTSEGIHCFSKIASSLISEGEFLDSTSEGVHFFSNIASSLISEVSRVFLSRPLHTSNPRRWHHGWRRPKKFSKFVPPETVKIRSLDLSILRFPCKTYFKLLKLSLRKKVNTLK